MTPAQSKRLARKARELGKSPSEAGALLIEEGLRRDEFAFIDFRNSPIGRHAFIQGSTLAVWEIAWLAKTYSSAEETARHLHLPLAKVQAALNYARAFPEEIDPIIYDQENTTFEDLKRLLPQIEELRVPIK